MGRIKVILQNMKEGSRRKRIVFKWILEKSGVRVWTETNWFRIESSGGPL
jgi:hypothetical protein